MKRLLCILLACTLLVSLAGWALADTYSATVPGYNGDMTVEVDLDGDTITAIRIPEDHESSPVKKRACPVMIARILEAQTPVVDSLTAATFSSYAIKSGVAEALKQAGREVGAISFYNEESTAEPVKLDAVEADIVIIGAGPAGQSAAIAAAEAGIDASRIIVLEKLDITGGNGKFDMVLFNHAGSKAQELAGIEDSAEKLFEDRKAGGAWDSDARLMAEAEMTMQMDEWYRGMGIELNYVYDTRSHLAEKDAYAGEELLDGIEGRVKELGVDLRTGTRAVDFIMEDGRLAGVTAQHGGEIYDIRAKAVVIATGGFCQNPELLAKYTAEGTEKLRSSNQIGATGDMVPLFEKYGFQLGHMDKTTVFSFMISRGRELTGERVAPQSYDYVQVNVDGQRFTNETVSYGLPRALDVMAQPGGKSFMIFDQSMVDFSFRIGKHAKAGLIEKADTLEELAEKLGINAENLVQTVADYNKFANGEIKEDPFRGEKVPARPINAEGPYYGMQIESAIHMTKGGVVCDENARCLDANGAVIPGAFAAGEVTDTSANFSAAFVFGRIAGQQAAEEILGK